MPAMLPLSLSLSVCLCLSLCACLAFFFFFFFVRRFQVASGLFLSGHSFQSVGVSWATAVLRNRCSSRSAQECCKQATSNHVTRSLDDAGTRVEGAKLNEKAN